MTKPTRADTVKTVTNCLQMLAQIYEDQLEREDALPLDDDDAAMVADLKEAIRAALEAAEGGNDANQI